MSNNARLQSEKAGDRTEGQTGAHEESRVHRPMRDVVFCKKENAEEFRPDFCEGDEKAGCENKLISTASIPFYSPTRINRIKDRIPQICLTNVAEYSA